MRKLPGQGVSRPILTRPPPADAVRQKIVKTALFPTSHIKGDWYKKKGYENFDDYLAKQRSDIKAPLNGVLNDVDLELNTVKSYNTKDNPTSLIMLLAMLRLYIFDEFIKLLTACIPY